MRVYRSLQIGEPPTSGGSLARTAAAIDDAVAGAPTYFVLPLGGPADDPALRDAIARAGVPSWSRRATTGRTSPPTDASLYPAMYRFPNLVTVAASDRQRRAARPGYTAGSNWGLRHVDLAAPGRTSSRRSPAATPPLHRWHLVRRAPGRRALALGRTLAPEATAAELVGEVTRSVRRTSSLDRPGSPPAGPRRRRVPRGDPSGWPASPDRPELGTFSDVPIGGPHAFNVDCIAWWGVAQGVDGTRFAPVRSVTRGQMASFLARTLDAADERPQDPPSGLHRRRRATPTRRRSTPSRRRGSPRVRGRHASAPTRR
jgi:hypothetical protein